MAEAGFDIKKFVDDSKNVLVAPKDFFATMAKEGGFVEPLIKALIYGLASGVLSLIWNLLGAPVYLLTSPVMILVYSVIGAIIGLFIGAVIILIISAICGGTTDFETNTRVSAAMMVLMPINSLLSFTYLINFTLASIVSLAVFLYGMFILYHAITGTLGGKEGTAKVVAIVISALLGLLMVGGMICGSAVKGISDQGVKSSEDFLKDNKDAAEALKRLEELSKKMEEAAKEAEEK